VAAEARGQQPVGPGASPILVGNRSDGQCVLAYPISGTTRNRRRYLISCVECGMTWAIGRGVLRRICAFKELPVCDRCSGLHGEPVDAEMADWWKARFTKDEIRLMAWAIEATLRNTL